MNLAKTCMCSLARRLPILPNLLNTSWIHYDSLIQWRLPVKCANLRVTQQGYHLLDQRRQFLTLNIILAFHPSQHTFLRALLTELLYVPLSHNYFPVDRALRHPIRNIYLFLRRRMSLFHTVTRTHLKLGHLWEKKTICVVQESRKVKAKGMYQVRAFLFCHSLMQGRRETIR